MSNPPPHPPQAAVGPFLPPPWSELNPSTAATLAPRGLVLFSLLRLVPRTMSHKEVLSGY